MCSLIPIETLIQSYFDKQMIYGLRRPKWSSRDDNLCRSKCTTYFICHLNLQHADSKQTNVQAAIMWLPEFITKHWIEYQTTRNIQPVLKTKGKHFN